MDEGLLAPASPLSDTLLFKCMCVFFQSNNQVLPCGVFFVFPVKLPLSAQHLDSIWTHSVIEKEENDPFFVQSLFVSSVLSLSSLVQ